MGIRAGDIARLVKERGWDVREAQMILGDLLYTFYDDCEGECEKSYYEESYVEEKERKDVLGK